MKLWVYGLIWFQRTYLFPNTKDDSISSIFNKMITIRFSSRKHPPTHTHKPSAPNECYRSLGFRHCLSVCLIAHYEGGGWMQLGPRYTKPGLQAEKHEHTINSKRIIVMTDCLQAGYGITRQSAITIFFFKYMMCLFCFVFRLQSGLSKLIWALNCLYFVASNWMG